MSRQATEWRRRIVTALCRLESDSPSEDVAFDYSFARRVVNAALEGWAEPYVTACYYVFGLHPAKLIPALAARQANSQWELYRRFVNADVVKAVSVGTQARRKGVVQAMPQPQGTRKNALPVMPRKAKKAVGSV